MNDRVIAHHGVKGMRWGVRRYQNKDGSLTPAGRKRYLASANKQANRGIRSQEYREKHTIPAGTTIYRTTVNQNESLGGKKYVTYLSSDRNLYKGGWVRKSANAREGYNKHHVAYEKAYKLKEDLTVPSREEVQQVVYDAVTKNRKATFNMLNTWYDMFAPRVKQQMALFMSDSEFKKKWNKEVNDVVDEFKDTPVKQAYYTAFQTFGKNSDLADSVIAELKKRGYNAMVDEAGVGGQNGYGREGVDPLIIFDGESSLSDEKTRAILEREERKAQSEFNDWYKRAKRRSGEWSDDRPGKIL